MTTVHGPAPMTADQPTGTMRCQCGWVTPTPPRHEYSDDITSVEFFVAESPTAMADVLTALSDHIKGA